MNLGIFGARDACWVKTEIERTTDNKIICIIDNNQELWKDNVIDPHKASDLYKSKKIDAILVAVRNGFNRQAITKQLMELGISRIGLIKPSVITYQWAVEMDDVWWIDELKKPLVHYLEIHATDACNLNCKGCLHFSNLFSKDEIPDFEQQINDIKKISEKCEIFHLRILGGEPLLNENLDKMIVKLREILPKTDMGIVTNGTLILKQSPELFKVMDQNKVGFNITLYPPTHSMKEKIYKYLNEYGVSYGSHIAKVDEFSKGFMLTPNNGEVRSHLNCVAKNCFFLYKGKLYKCAPEALINRFYERFDIPLNMNGGINIYDETLEWTKVIQNLYDNPVSLCRYCSNELEGFEWTTANQPQIEDWIISNTKDD